MKITQFAKDVRDIATVVVWFGVLMGALALGGCGALSSTQIDPSTSNQERTNHVVGPATTSERTIELWVEPNHVGGDGLGSVGRGGDDLELPKSP